MFKKENGNTTTTVAQIPRMKFKVPVLKFDAEEIIRRGYLSSLLQIVKHELKAELQPQLLTSKKSKNATPQRNSNALEQQTDLIITLFYIEMHSLISFLMESNSMILKSAGLSSTYETVKSNPRIVIQWMSHKENLAQESIEAEINNKRDNLYGPLIEDWDISLKSGMKLRFDMLKNPHELRAKIKNIKTGWKNITLLPEYNKTSSLFQSLNKLQHEEFIKFWEKLNKHQSEMEEVLLSYVLASPLIKGKDDAKRRFFEEQYQSQRNRFFDKLAGVINGNSMLVSEERRFFRLQYIIPALLRQKDRYKKSTDIHSEIDREILSACKGLIFYSFTEIDFNMLKTVNKHARKLKVKKPQIVRTLKSKSHLDYKKNIFNSDSVLDLYSYLYDVEDETEDTEIKKLISTIRSKIDEGRKEFIADMKTKPETYSEALYDYEGSYIFDLFGKKAPNNTSLYQMGYVNVGKGSDSSYAASSSSSSTSITFFDQNRLQVTEHQQMSEMIKYGAEAIVEISNKIKMAPALLNQKLDPEVKRILENNPYELKPLKQRKQIITDYIKTVYTAMCAPQRQASSSSSSTSAASCHLSIYEVFALQDKMSPFLVTKDPFDLFSSSDDTLYKNTAQNMQEIGLVALRNEMDGLTSFSEKQNLLQYAHDHALFARTPGMFGTLFGYNSKGKIQELMKEIAPENTALISVKI